MSDNEWIHTEEAGKMFQFSLKLFFQAQGEQVCLNVIKNQENVGKFYCSEKDFIAATSNYGSLTLTDRQGRTLSALPAPCQSLNVCVKKSDLLQIVAF